MSPPPGPGLDGPLLTVRRYCESKTPAEHQDQFRVECTIRGKSITIYDCQSAVASRHGTRVGTYAGSASRYDPVTTSGGSTVPTATAAGTSTTSQSRRLGSKSLREIDEDPTGIFWG